MAKARSVRSERFSRVTDTQTYQRNFDYIFKCGSKKAKEETKLKK